MAWMNGRSSRRAFGFGAVFGHMLHSLFTMGLDSPRALRVLLVMGALSLLFLSSPSIQYLLLFSGIGIPLLPATVLLPPIVLIWCCILVFRLVLPFKGGLRTFAACIATALLLFLPAQWLNTSAYVRSLEMTALDHNSTTLPLRTQTLAIVNRGHGKNTRCDRLCLHALLTGAASTVIVSPAPISTAVPDPQEITTAYYFERRPVCPGIELDPRHYVLPQNGIPVLDRSLIKPQRNAAEMATQRIASGDCLMSRKARLSQADLMILHGPVLEERQRNTGFLLSLEGMKVARLSLYQPTGSGGFKEVFRETSGTAKRFFPFLVPMASWVLDESSGWLRTTFAFNDHDYAAYNAWDAFGTLEDTLGIKLRLDDSNYRKTAQDSIIAVMDAKRPPTEAEWQAFSLYWKGLNLFGQANTQTGPDRRDAAIALRLVHAPQMPLPDLFGDFTRYAIRANLVQADELADGFAARLGTGGADKDIRMAAQGLMHMPDDILREHLDLLADLARSPDKRRLTARLLSNLHLGGPDAAPLLRDLIETGIARDDLNAAQQGLVGLCKVGPAAAPVLAQLNERLMALEKGDRKRYFQTRIAVSAKLGLDKESLRRAIPYDVMLREKPDWFDRQFKRGSSQSWTCRT